jgi:hypothetical protein
LLARILQLQHHHKMKSFLIAVGIFLAIGLLAYFTRYVPDSEQLEFEKKFDRDAVLVKTCRPDPTIESGVAMKVYRFEEKLWFRERKTRWKQVDGKPENVCDLLDVEEKRSK